jgi:hypothetical protein
MHSQRTLSCLLLVVCSSACSLAMKPPKSAAKAQRIEASYGSSVMQFEEFHVDGIIERGASVSLTLGTGRIGAGTRSVNFTVKKGRHSFAELRCSAGTDRPSVTLGGWHLNSQHFKVHCDGPDFTLELEGDPEKPIVGVATYRGERFPLRTGFDTESSTQSAHIGLHVAGATGWLASADIQGPTWVSTSLSPTQREAIVLANFGWASRRNVVMNGTSGVTVTR